MKPTVHACVAAVALAIIAVASFVVSRPAFAADDEKKSTSTFEVYKDKGGDFRWRLRAKNTNVIASSGQGYSSKQSCLDGIESVKKQAADAPVKEVSADEAEK
jgi:uncharacterized protein YegP (UPF0339 family)